MIRTASAMSVATLLMTAAYAAEGLGGGHLGELEADIAARDHDTVENVDAKLDLISAITGGDKEEIAEAVDEQLKEEENGGNDDFIEGDDGVFDIDPEDDLDDDNGDNDDTTFDNGETTDRQ